jgi:Guanyl-specific ribonuclease Sa
MNTILNILKNYKKHPVLATIIVLAIIGLLIYGLITANNADPGQSGDLTVTPALSVFPSATDTPTPTVKPDTPTPTKAQEVTPTKAPATPTPTTAPATPTPTETPATPTPTKSLAPATPTPSVQIDEDGWYYDKDNVALYIHTYGHLPGNYIKKKDAEALGWSGGSIEKYAKGKAIGGDYFGNYEGLLPKKNGRSYYECDIDTKGAKSRGAKRIIFSNDGLIFYTDDHYESFKQLY